MNSVHIDYAQRTRTYIEHADGKPSVVFDKNSPATLVLSGGGDGERKVLLFTANAERVASVDRL